MTERDSRPLKELKAAWYNEGNVEKKDELKAKIQEREDYCINILKYDLKRMEFNKKKSYRFATEKDGGWNIPDGALTGKDRCAACKYNSHSWCEGRYDAVKPEFRKGCFANA